jgi:hypothetical protein
VDAVGSAAAICWVLWGALVPLSCFKGAFSWVPAVKSVSGC